MGLLAPLAALLGLEVEGLVARARSAALVYGLTALFTLVGATFLLVAAYLALADWLGAIPAALVLAGGFLVLAIAVYLGARIERSRRQQQLSARRRASETGALVSTAAITALPLLARSPMLVRIGLPAAALIAFALMRKNKDDE